MSNYEAIGHIKEIFNIQSGTSKSGNNWKKREFLIETEGQYHKNICFNLFGDNVDFLDNLRIGDIVKVLFDVESREYNGRWYHNLNSFNVSKIDFDIKNEPEPKFEQEAINNDDDEENDLPF